MVWRVTPQWVPSCWAAACILLATPFNERPCRWRAPETSSAKGRCSIPWLNERNPDGDGDLLEAYSSLSAAQCGQFVVSSLSIETEVGGLSRVDARSLAA